MHKLLQCYPFSDPSVVLAEGFSEYDGLLGDQPDTPHKGIDYVLQNESLLVPFDVYAMHDGDAFQGKSDTWGNFVIVYAPIVEGMRYSTVYAHLDDIDSSIAEQFTDRNGERVANQTGTPILFGRKLGNAGTSGLTHGVVQLHVELHAKEVHTNEWKKLDPYGLYDRGSSGKYPQPGLTLKGLDHAWVMDLPPFAHASS